MNLFDKLGKPCSENQRSTDTNCDEKTSCTILTTERKWKKSNIRIYSITGVGKVFGPIKINTWKTKD